MDRITLSKVEVDLLRSLFWKLKDAQLELQNTLNDTAKKHGVDIAKSQYNVTEDFKYLVKVVR